MKRMRKKRSLTLKKMDSEGGVMNYEYKLKDVIDYKSKHKILCKGFWGFRVLGF